MSAQRLFVVFIALLSVWTGVHAQNQNVLAERTCRLSGQCWCNASNLQVGYCVPSPQACVTFAVGVPALRCSYKLIATSVIPSAYNVVLGDLSTQAGCDLNSFCWCTAAGSPDAGQSAAYCVPSQKACLNAARYVRGVGCAPKLPVSAQTDGSRDLPNPNGGIGSFSIIVSSVADEAGCTRNNMCFCTSEGSPDRGLAASGYCVPTEAACLAAAAGVRSVRCASPGSGTPGVVTPAPEPYCPIQTCLCTYKGWSLSGRVDKTACFNQYYCSVVIGGTCA